MAKGFDKFKEYLEQSSKGRIAVEVYKAGALGKTREVIELERIGKLEVCGGGAGWLQTYAPEMGIALLPYIWKDTSTMFEVMDGPLGDYLNKKAEEKGIHILGWFNNGFRHVTNRLRPIKSLEDFKGLKIRSLATPVHIAFFKELGAAPTPMAWAELYDALRMKVVDAQENPPALVHAARFYEVQKYYSLTGHVNEPAGFHMSKIVYDKLPDDLKLAVDIAARKATLWEREECSKDNQAAFKKLEEAGMQINEVPKETMDQIRRIAHEKVYPAVIADFGPIGKELVDLFIWANE
jgi:tripartite ATP-independent transporter DctP family solute receptor